MLSNDKFIGAGAVQKTDQLFRTHSDISVTRYNADCTLDTGFATNGSISIDVAGAMNGDLFSLGERSDGRIIVGGRTRIDPNRQSDRSLQLSLIKLSVNGSLEGKSLITEAESFYGQVLIQPNNKIITVSTGYGVNFRRDLVLTRSSDVPLVSHRFQAVGFHFYSIDASARTNPAVYRPGERKWYVVPNTSVGPFFGRDGDILAVSDYFGEFFAELAVFRSSNGTWYIGRDYNNSAQNFVAVQ